MSVVIVGGNECMTRMYKDLCAEYDCSAKIYTKSAGNLKNVGRPDLLIFFTSTVSHKMVNLVLGQTKNAAIKTVRSHSSSASALRNILEEYAVKECRA